jgi:putative ABC transport system ATP-binding protein
MIEGKSGLVLADVSKSYGGPAVLRNASMEVRSGEIIAVQGRSGSGKSTLLKLIGGLDKPDTGSIFHSGANLNEMTDDELTVFRRYSLGFVFQFFNLIPTLTATENIELPLALAGMPYRDRQLRIAELRADLELKGLDQRFPDELSGGEQQRIAIARALANSPGLVVADEPTGNLDAETAHLTLELLRSICHKRSTTLVMATHSREAASIADRVLHIRDGLLEPS